MCQGFGNFSSFFASFFIGKISHQQHKGKVMFSIRRVQLIATLRPTKKLALQEQLSVLPDFAIHNSECEIVHGL